MLTPRRTVLLLAGFVLFAGAYVVYDRLLGWLDGLPQLPAAMLVPSDGTFSPPPRTESPTLQKIKDAFGDGSPELNTTHYETQLEFRNGESSVVVAAGKVPSSPKSKRVTLSPFSVAVFSKPKPVHLRQPGEVVEISTIHADKGVLEFDQVINNPADMRSGKAKLVQLELVSDFAEALPDPRRGVVHITNNQRCADPNRFLILRTTGPVFYRDPKAVAGTPAAQGPDFWTDAPVEIVDRQNLPRPIGSAAPATAATKSEELRNAGAIAAILEGQRLPPPTVTAVGLRVYLEPDPPPGQKKKEPKPGANPINGVRRLEFLEQVVMHLWIDNGQSLVGGAPDPVPGQPAAKGGGGFALVPPHPLIAAVAGGLAPGAYHARLMGRALLQIDTRGAFAYDAEKALARFDVVPHSDPSLPNDVQVTKIPPRGGTSGLFSQVLELEFNGGPTSGARAANAPAIKKLHAWTATPSRYLTLVSQDDAAEAYGHDLTHEQGAGRTVLTGAPLYVVRERNVLSAAVQPGEVATLTTEPGPPLPDPATGKPGPRKQQMTVRGPGKVELFDAATNATSLVATWKTSLVQSKEVVGGRERDLFVLSDDAKFEDLKADYWLKGNILRVWLEPRGEASKAPEPKAVAEAKSPAGGGAKPSLVVAIGQVRSHSTEYDVEDAEQLTVHIKDTTPAAPAAGAAVVGPAVAVATGTAAPPRAPGSGPPVPPAPAPMSGAAAVAGPAAPRPPEPQPVAKGPDRPKPPYKIKARTIETFLTRTATPPPPAKPGEPHPAPGSKYQLDRARCEDNVFVHQEPTDPAKPRGVDIIGRLLLIDGSSDGSVMTVFGWPNRLGEVHQEEMSLLGPKVVLNQVLNAASVEGRGALTMPTGSDLAGGELARPEVVVIHWRDSMAFNGAQKSAVFVGKVSAKQGESWVLCHTMNVAFDRPMYFNPAQKKEAAAKGGEKARIDKVFCYPAPADAADDRRELDVIYNQVDYDKDGKLIKAQQLRAQELKMEAQAQDPDGKDGKYQRVVAEGPGTLRIWQPGEANPAGPPGGKPAPKPPMPPAPGAPKPKDKDEEMKLTVIDFDGRMTGVDKGKVYQSATFGGSVKAISVPADSPAAVVDKNNLPPRALLVTCEKELVVWTHKKPGAVPVQHMDAIGNAYVRSDDYDGSAPLIQSEGKKVTLTGTDVIPARISSRFGESNSQVGKKIEYDRAGGTYRVVDGFGGSITPKK